MTQRDQDKGPANIEEMALSMQDWLDLEDPKHENRWIDFNNSYPIIGKYVLENAYKKFPNNPDFQKDIINFTIDVVNMISYIDSNKKSV